MNIDIVKELVKKGFEVVDFVDVRNSQRSFENIHLTEESTERVLNMLDIKTDTAALSGEVDQLFVSGAPRSGESPDSTAPLKYEVKKATV